MTVSDRVREYRKQLCRGIAALVSLVCIAAGLTVDLPVALPRWLTWLPTVGAALRGVFPVAVFVLSFVVFVVLSGPSFVGALRRAAPRILPLLAKEKVLTHPHPESVQQLRQLHRAWEIVLDNLHSFLANRVCGYQPLSTFERQVLAEVVSEYVLKDYDSDRFKLRIALPETPSEVDQEAFANVCTDVANWIVKWNQVFVWMASKAGRAIKGVPLFETEEYEKLRELQDEAFRTLRNLRGRTDGLGEFADILEEIPRLPSVKEIREFDID